jgi:hypothetical protein
VDRNKDAKMSGNGRKKKHESKLTKRGVGFPDLLLIGVHQEVVHV